MIELQGSYHVAVVGPDNRVDLRQVRPGERIGALWIIDSGLNPGERVVAEGVGKVKQGIVVTPKPYAFPSTAAGRPSPIPAGRSTPGGR